MSSLLEIKSEDAFNKHSASLPPTTLQIIYFKAEWAAPVSSIFQLEVHHKNAPHVFFYLTTAIALLAAFTARTCLLTISSANK